MASLTLNARAVGNPPPASASRCTLVPIPKQQHIHMQAPTIISEPCKLTSKSIKQKAASGLTTLFHDMATNLCNALLDLANSLNPPSLDPHLAFNFLPLLHESPPTPCTRIEGTIPSALNGVFLRNGPNPLHPPQAGYHYFDGHGMIHSVKIQNGHATHACRYTRTYRYTREKAAGRPLFINPLGELHGFEGIAKSMILLLRHVLGLVDILQGYGPANAGLAYFDGKLLAMSEEDMPYRVSITKDGDIRTVGRFNFHGKLKSCMTAHPKVDPDTQEMFSFSNTIFFPPYLKFFRVNQDGTKMKDVPITIKEPVLMHDFAITKRYAVFHDNQMVFRLHNMLKGGGPIVYDANKVPRVGILPRYATSEASMRWFDCPKTFGNSLHFLNAWDEGDEVVMVGSVIKPVDHIFALKYKDLEKIQCRLTEFRVNLKSGRVTHEQISYANIDVGRINERYLGKKTRYVYLCTSGPWPKFSGICKVDLQAPRMPEAKGITLEKQEMSTNEPCIVGWRNFGNGCYGSEPFFVPRSSDPSLKEDDGFLVTFVHNEDQDHSQLLILDAQSPLLPIVASITLPCRVPYGFHSLFISETQVQKI